MLKSLFYFFLICNYSCKVIAELKQTKPNIIIVVSDQQSYDDIGCYGNNL